MAVRLIQQGVCAPLLVDEVKHYLRIDDNSEAETALLESLIETVSSEASEATGREWVENKWEWEIEDFQLEKEISFPVCPVTKVEIFDEDEELEEGAEPTDISSSLVKVKLPSLDPRGTPLVGSLLAVQEFPQNVRIVLTAGYPVKNIGKPIPQTDSVVVDQSKTSYTSTKIHLVFNRPVKGHVEPDNFKVQVEGEEYVPQKTYFEKDGVTLEFLEDQLQENVKTVLTFVGGYIEDEFENYVLPLVGFTLPNVEFKEDTDFAEPTPVLTEQVYKSLAPNQVKQWMLIRIGTLYSQRSEIAKGTGAMYPTRFIDGLLKQYKVTFA